MFPVRFPFIVGWRFCRYTNFSLIVVISLSSLLIFWQHWQFVGTSSFMEIPRPEATSSELGFKMFHFSLVICYLIFNWEELHSWASYISNFIIYFSPFSSDGKDGNIFLSFLLPLSLKIFCSSYLLLEFCICGKSFDLVWS